MRLKSRELLRKEKVKLDAKEHSGEQKQWTQDHSGPADPAAGEPKFLATQSPLITFEKDLFCRRSFVHWERYAIPALTVPKYNRTMSSPADNYWPEPCAACRGTGSFLFDSQQISREHRRYLDDASQESPEGYCPFDYSASDRPKSFVLQEMLFAYRVQNWRNRS